MSSREIAEVVRPIRLRTVVTAEGETTTPIVTCPRMHESIDAHACAACMRVVGLEWELTRGGEVRCLVSNQAAPPTPDRRADLPERAARTRVDAVADPIVTCVRPDVKLERVREVFASTRQRAVAVVDVENKLVALVSRSDLTRAPTEGTVADVMTSCVHSLPEDSPLSYAVSLLAHEDVAQVPIVTAEGMVTGICHALDVLRWVADGLGYSVPTKR